MDYSCKVYNSITMPELHDIEIALRSSLPILIIETLEEKRLLQQFVRIGLKRHQAVFDWSDSEGLRCAETDRSRPIMNTQSAEEVLRHIKATSVEGIYLLLDMHPYVSDPLLIRLIKDIAQDFDVVARKLVFVSHHFDIPLEVRHLSQRMHISLPDVRSLKRLILEEARYYETRKSVRMRGSPGTIDHLARNLLGVTASEARRLIRHAIENDGALTEDDLEIVARAKYELINKNNIVSFEYDAASFADLAGFGKLKNWIDLRSRYLHSSRPGIDRPKGVLLTGIQGSGKSLAARAIAGHTQLPLLRLDFSSLYDKYIGETEKNLRHALEIANTMAPCVLWMDELEKGIAGDDQDGGVARRVLGSLLTWMADNDRGVFIVATSNDIKKLPPELIRKGRLDEIFFVDLPGSEARKAIIIVHLKRRELEPEQFDLDLLARASEGFSGAEIEQAVVSAIYSADANEQQVNTELVIQEIDRTRPMSVVMAESIAQLRAWANDRTLLVD
jgi:SpoVK/Ycf46/Vps4 family AAA+-type ATPase